MKSRPIQYTGAGTLTLAGLAFGLAATTPSVHAELPAIPLYAVALDQVLSARLAYGNGSAFLNRVRVGPNGNVEQIEIVHGTRWPWMSELVATEATWLDAEAAAYVTRTGAVLLDPDALSGEPAASRRVDAGRVAPSLLLGASVDPPGNAHSGELLMVRRMSGEATEYVVRDYQLLPWRTNTVRRFVSDCANFVPEERRLELGACTRRA